MPLSFGVARFLTLSSSHTQYGELSLTTNPSFALYNSPMHSVSVASNYSPGSNIYTRIPTRPSTALAGAYLGNEHQLKLSPSGCAETGLIIPTTSSATPYVYTSYGNGQGPMGGDLAGTTSGGGGLHLKTSPDNNALASSYVLYGTTGRKQQSPNRLLGGGGIVGGLGPMNAIGVGGGATTVTTPLISTTNYNGFGKTGLVTTTTTTPGNYDEFIS